MNTKIKVILQKSFEFRTDELQGADLEEKALDAVKKARVRLDQLLSSGGSKVLLEDKVIINPKR